MKETAYGKIGGAYIASALTDIRLTNEEILSLLYDDSRCDDFRQVLDEVIEEKRATIKQFCERIGAVAEEVLGVASYVPHMHFDPIVHAAATPTEVADTEIAQLRDRTSVLIVLCDDPATGAGIEVGHCNIWEIPIILLYRKKPSRLILGLQRVRATIHYESEDDALIQLQATLIPLHEQPMLLKRHA